LDTATRIETILRERFAPEHFELSDLSRFHEGHPGASSGGGHYRVLLVSRAFEGRSRLERHRAIHEALGGMIGGEVHALALRAATPSEWGNGPSHDLAPDSPSR
jgi:BolA protein